MDELKDIALAEMEDQHFDCLAVGVVDFSSRRTSFFQLREGSFSNRGSFLYFDLASLTKPLTLSALFHRNETLFDENMRLLLSHRGGLPSWGRLSLYDWKEVVLSKKIQESVSVYSDLSPLRLMLELEEKTSKKFKDLTSFYWHPKFIHWRDIKDRSLCPVTGMRGGRQIRGVVHDDNAFLIGEFCSHAGMFATIDGLCQSLLNLDYETGFVDKQNKDFSDFDLSQRFLNGWDTVSDPAKSLAGRSSGPKTFGHLGFTGTSIWIDSEKRIGSVILTNATRNYWYQREGLTRLRKKLGTFIMSRYTSI